MSSVQRTSVLSLTVMGGSGLVGGRLLPLVIESFDGTAPRIGWSAALALLLAAVILGVFAWNTWQSLHKRHERMTSDYGIRMLALSKASGLAGALASGGYLGFALGFVDSYDTPLGKERVIRAGLAGIAGLVMMIAGLLLERALQIPDGDDIDGKEGGDAAADAAPA